MFKKENKSQGQALAEFAIVILVLLLIMFFIIEVSRILWGWVTVQNAAREGARYAVTGQFEPDCFSEVPPCPDPRVASIEDRIEERLVGLRTVRGPSVLFEDDYALFIQIYGVNEFGELQENFAGLPGQPMVVRVIYNVPIIVPILDQIVETVPVMGQVTVTNEPFGQLGGIDQGQPVAPNLPPVPTAGVTPSPTPTNTPSPTGTPTPGPSPTATSTATITPSPTPLRCNVEFEGGLIEGATTIGVTGDLGTTIEIVDLFTNQVIGTAAMDGPFDGHACEGFVVVTLTGPLVGNHTIIVESSDNSFDTGIVQPGTSTPTPIPTNTPQPTNTPTPTTTHTPTGTPIQPFIVLNLPCANGPNIQFTVNGSNWDTTSPVNLFWNGNLQDIIPIGHGGNFQRTFQFQNVAAGSHELRAQSLISGSNYVTAVLLEVPCPNVTPTPTLILPTDTPSPADLIIVGDPVLVSTPPIVGYQPVSFQMVVSNTGDIDVSSQFFVDVYFDVPPSEVTATGIDISFSSGYLALSGLAGRTSRTITVTSSTGFTGPSTNPRTVHGMVDSVVQIDELDETNNVAGPIQVAVTPGATPTPAPTTTGSGEVSGIVRALYTSWVPQGRANVFLVLVEPLNPPGSQKTQIAHTQSNIDNGFYSFLSVPPPPAPGDFYEVVACFEIDQTQRVGTRPGIISTNQFANVYMLTSATGCPYSP